MRKKLIAILTLLIVLTTQSLIIKGDDGQEALFEFQEEAPSFETGLMPTEQEAILAERPQPGFTLATPEMTEVQSTTQPMTTPTSTVLPTGLPQAKPVLSTVTSPPLRINLPPRAALPLTIEAPTALRLPFGEETETKLMMDSIASELTSIADPNRPIKSKKAAQKALEGHLKWIRNRLLISNPYYAQLQLLFDQLQDVLNKLVSNQLQQEEPKIQKEIQEETNRILRDIQEILTKLVYENMPLTTIETARTSLEQDLEWIRKRLRMAHIRKQLNVVGPGDPTYSYLTSLLEQIQTTLKTLEPRQPQQKEKPIPAATPQEEARQRLAHEAMKLVQDLHSLNKEQEQYIQSTLTPAVAKIINDPEGDFARLNYDVVIRDLAKAQSNFSQQTDRMVQRAENLVTWLTIPGAEIQLYSSLIKQLNDAIAQQIALQEALVDYRINLIKLLYAPFSSLQIPAAPA